MLFYAACKEGNLAYMTTGYYDDGCFLAFNSQYFKVTRWRVVMAVVKPSGTVTKRALG